jgi:tetratricopeptide (TPR) repeat protein
MLKLLFVLACMILVAPTARAIGPESSELQSEPDYRDGERLITQGDYAAAIVVFEQLRVTYPRAPEVLNWLGFAHRKLKNYPVSKEFYDAALAADPNYLPALEYQGEWYLETGDVARARANLRRLEELCGRCHEWRDLADSIARATGTN